MIRYAGAPIGRTDGVWKAACLVGVATLVVLAIWLPFGFHLGGLIEEWDILGLFSIQHRFFIASPHSPLPVHALRPFTILPHAVANGLDSDSFFYWHVILMLSLVGKGAASGYLVWKALGRWTPALAMAALVIVYPADTMQLAFRGIHINVALTMLLLGAACCVSAYGASSRRTQWSGAVAAGVLLAAACAMYEASLPLVVLPWAILVVRDGLLDAVKLALKRWSVSLVWVLGLAVYIAYAGYAWTQVLSYQGGLLSNHPPFMTSLANLFRIGAVRGLVDGWVDAFAIWHVEFVDHVYPLVVAIVVVLVGTWMAVRRRPRQDDARRTSSAPVVRLLVLGAVLMLVGYVPYIFSIPHQMISQRTYLFATPGAAMCWVALLVILGRVGRWIALSAACVLFTAGLGAQLFQFHHYIQIYRTQQSLLASIVTQYDGDPTKDLIVLDGSDRLGDIWMLGGDGLPNALSYFYGHGLKRILICRMPQHEWTVADDMARKGTCSESADAWTFAVPSPVKGPGYEPSAVSRTCTDASGPCASVLPSTTYVIPKAQAAVVSLDPDAGDRPVAPLPPKVPADSTLGRRYEGVLRTEGPAFGDRMFLDRSSLDRVDFDFGRWWSLEKPTRGTGWRTPEWIVHGMKQSTYAWKSAPRASLDVNFQPALDAPYELTGTFNIVLNDAIRQSLHIVVNGKPVTIEWLGAGTFKASVPPGYLAKGRNRLEFESDVDDHFFGLSMALARLHLKRQ